MKNKLGIIHLLPLILIGILVLGASFYFYGKQNSKSSVETQTPEPLQEASEEQTEMDMALEDFCKNMNEFGNTSKELFEIQGTLNTSTWKTFEDGAFTVKYPPSKEVSSSSGYGDEGFFMCYEGICQDWEFLIKDATDVDCISLKLTSNFKNAIYYPTIKIGKYDAIGVKTQAYPDDVDQTDILHGIVDFEGKKLFYTLRLNNIYETTLSTLSIKEPNQKNCGGIAGFVCDEGYTCQMTEDYPDAMGVCIKDPDDYTEIKELTADQARQIDIFPPSNPIKHFWCKFVTKRCD